MDHFDLIRPLLEEAFAVAKDDAVFVAHTLLRRKDLPEQEKSTKLVRTYHFESTSEYDRCRPGIVRDCRRTRARAYIDVVPKSVERAALVTLKNVADLILNKQFRAVAKAYDKSCGDPSCNLKAASKTWMIDVDDPNVVDRVKTQLADVGSAIRLELPTKAGFHLLVEPFPLNEWREIPDASIHRRAQTLMYMFYGDDDVGDHADGFDD